VDDKDICPGCKKYLHHEDVVCIECGYDRREGRKHRTRHDVLERRWDSGNSLVVRLVLLPLLLAPLCLCMIWNAVVGLLVVVYGAVALVLFLGTYYSIRVVRNSRGDPLLYKRWHIAFIPVRPRAVDLRRFDFIELDYSSTSSSTIWMYFALAGVLGAILYRLGPGGRFTYRETYTLRLSGRRTVKELKIYSGPTQATMQDIVETLQGLADLELVRK
jgi:hypothetical protein